MNLLTPSAVAESKRPPTLAPLPAPTLVEVAQRNLRVQRALVAAVESDTPLAPPSPDLEQ
jgi:hypothetical protein